MSVASGRIGELVARLARRHEQQARESFLRACDQHVPMPQPGELVRS
jgi:hypothetical protein